MLHHVKGGPIISRLAHFRFCHDREEISIARFVIIESILTDLSTPESPGQIADIDIWTYTSLNVNVWRHRSMIRHYGMKT